LRINLLVAVFTLISLAYSKERKLPPQDATFALLVVFFLWMTLNSAIGVWPAQAWLHWDQTWRLMLLGLLVAATATNKVRIHALVMVWTLSLAFYGVKGGGFTLMNGGTNHVIGPPNSTIADNNQLALAILMSLPLANYLRIHSGNMLVRRVILISMILCLVSVLGSYSRGAFVGLAGLVVVAWARSKKKWLYPLVATAVIVPALTLMPAGYYDRMNSIQTANSDSSFQGRVDAWGVAFGYARDHFPFGAGFDAPLLPQVFNHYAPGKETHAAHSIFFQVLGDNGFMGLAIYLALLSVAFYNSNTIRRLTRNRPDFAWAYDLAGMLQLTLFVYCLGGAALSFAYYDGLWVAVGLLSAMREIVVRSTATSGWRKGMGDTRISRAPQTVPAFAPE
jgi:probable O-glycosylation ligase (exosortase A-associated)